MPIEKPNDDLYKLIKSIYDDVADELKLNDPFDPSVSLGTDPEKQYEHHRAIIESVSGGSDVFITEGRLVKTQVHVQPGVIRETIQDSPIYEGWK